MFWQIAAFILCFVLIVGGLIWIGHLQAQPGDDDIWFP